MSAAAAVLLCWETQCDAQQNTDLTLFCTSALYMMRCNADCRTKIMHAKIKLVQRQTHGMGRLKWDM